MAPFFRQARRGLQATLALTSLAVVSMAQANLVQNGSFENTTATITTQFYNQVANWSNGGPSAIGDSIVLPSWYTLGLYPGVGVAGALPQYSPDGGNWVFSDGDYFNSAITQTLTGLTPGAFYKISFWEGLIQDTEANVTIPGPVTGYWQVSLGSNTTSGAFMTGNGATLTFTNWQQENLVLQANSSTEVLSFLAFGTGDPPLVLLDGVDVAALPEPATLGLTLAAFLAGGAVYRRRRWQADAA
ncbi:MAG: PEP-CTERM sorting domain-containing protein [Burkholderiales bacterium]|nr:PEP-CTERM sorting domain-containing protein [Burkholderiales bacterium]